MKKIELKVDYKLDIDFSKLFDTWYKPMSEFLEDNYMYNMMLFLHEGYKFKNIVPKKEHIFKIFKKLKYDDVRVVIIGDEPYHDNSNTGIAYGQKDALVMNNEITEIEECIERTCYDNFNLHIDNTLENWVEQGVLPIYSSLTGEVGVHGKHKYHWRDFIRNLIKNINDYKPGTIFMLWGSDAQYFKQYINAKTNYILEAPSVREIASKGEMWDTQNFKDCNNIIEENNGKEFCIKW